MGEWRIERSCCASLSGGALAALVRSNMGMAGGAGQTAADWPASLGRRAGACRLYRDTLGVALGRGVEMAQALPSPLIRERSSTMSA